MGYDLYLRKVNKQKLQEATRYVELNEIDWDTLENCTEDEVNSFLPIFRKYFKETGHSYQMEDYHIIPKEKFLDMKRFLEEEMSSIYRDGLPLEEQDWNYMMMEMVHRHMCQWETNLEDSEIIFEHDC